MKVLKRYEAYNARRFSTPWVARVNPETAKIDFSASVGGYTAWKGEAGSLYVTKPCENAVYAYGPKDYRKNIGGYEYVQYCDGAFIPVSKTELIEVLCAGSDA